MPNVSSRSSPLRTRGRPLAPRPALRAIDLDDPSSWGNHWTLAGDTVRCEIEDANGDLQSVTAVSGFCPPDITLMYESSGGRARQITPQGTLRAFVVISRSDQIVIGGADRDGNETRPITC